MGVKVFNWTNKNKLDMLRHMVSMVINKAILKNWVHLQKYSKITSNAFYDTKLGTRLMLCCSTFTRRVKLQSILVAL